MTSTFLEISIISAGIILSTTFFFFYRKEKEGNYFCGVILMFLSLFIININQVMTIYSQNHLSNIDESGFREGKDFFNRTLIITTKTLVSTGDTLVIDTILGGEKDIYMSPHYYKYPDKDKRFISGFGGNIIYAIIPKDLRLNDTLFVEGTKLDTIYNSRGQKFFKVQHYHGQSLFDSDIYENIVFWKNLLNTEKP